MADLSFKISDLENIPSYIEEISGNEKIALESTYFLTYSHTIHGMNYVTKNYKVPLSLLRDDLAAHVEKNFDNKGLVVNDIKDIKELNINSNDFIIYDSVSGNKIDINIIAADDLIQGEGNITVSKTKSNISSTPDASSWKIIVKPIRLESSDNSIDVDVLENKDEYKWDIKAKPIHLHLESSDNSINVDVLENQDEYKWDITTKPIRLESSDNSINVNVLENQDEYKWDIKAKAAPYYISLLDKDVYNKKELLYLDKVDKRSIYIIAKDNLDYREQRSIGLNFIGYLKAENKDDAICSFKLYLNTVGCDRNTTLSGMYLKWAMGPDNDNYYSPTFLPGKIYSITFTSIPIRVFQGTSTEEDDIKYYYNGRAIIGQIDWFISY